MFWGLVLEPGKRYSTTVDKSFHVSMAALDCSSVKADNEILSVVLECDGQENILCNLTKQQRLLQSHLDLNFMTGDKVSFEVKGSGVVHLSGYLVPDDDDLMNMDGEEIGEEEEDEEDEEEEEEEEDDEVGEESPKKNEKQKGKRKTDVLQVNNAKKLKVDVDSDEDSDDDDDEDEMEDKALNTSKLAVDSDDDDEDSDDEDLSDEDDDDDDDEEGLEESEEEPTLVQTKKQQKTPQSANKKQQTPKQLQQSANKQNAITPILNGTGPNQQSGKKNKKKGQETPKGQTPQPANQNSVKGKNQKTPLAKETAASPLQKKVLEGGVIVKDLKEGHGQIVKSGQMVSVYYQGRLKTNNKVFDECKNGPGFKFRLGKGEVIKGWDVGVNGMKVGGLRMITCPPNMAYGHKGSPPQIPSNSALVFQVELKSIN